MKNVKSFDVKSFDELRNELHSLIEEKSISSEAVQKASRELDELILLYYKNANEHSE